MEKSFSLGVCLERIVRNVTSLRKREQEVTRVVKEQNKCNGNRWSFFSKSERERGIAEGGDSTDLLGDDGGEREGVKQPTQRAPKE